MTQRAGSGVLLFLAQPTIQAMGSPARQQHPMPPLPSSFPCVGPISSSNRSIRSQAAFLLINSSAVPAATSASEAPPLRGFRAFRRPLQRPSAPRPPVGRRQLEASAGDGRSRADGRPAFANEIPLTAAVAAPIPIPLLSLSARCSPLGNQGDREKILRDKSRIK